MDVIKKEIDSDPTLQEAVINNQVKHMLRELETEKPRQWIDDMLKQIYLERNEAFIDKRFNSDGILSRDTERKIAHSLFEHIKNSPLITNLDRAKFALYRGNMANLKISLYNNPYYLYNDMVSKKIYGKINDLYDDIISQHGEYLREIAYVTSQVTDPQFLEKFSQSPTNTPVKTTNNMNIYLTQNELNAIVQAHENPDNNEMTRKAIDAILGGAGKTVDEIQSFLSK